MSIKRNGGSLPRKSKRHRHLKDEHGRWPVAGRRSKVTTRVDPSIVVMPALHGENGPDSRDAT